jgi:hypothetical protein
MGTSNAIGGISLPPGDHEKLTRRAALTALGLAGFSGLAGCVGQNNLLWRHFGLLLHKPRAATLKRADVAKFAAASIAVRAGNRPEGLVLLDRIEGRDLYWLSSDRILLVTRGGRLTQTAGLRANLGHTVFPVPDPVDGAILSSSGERSTRLLDYEEFGIGLEADSEFRVEKKQPITILGAALPTLRVRERVRVRSLKWGFTNTYWAHEQTGAVWRSSQHFHPDYPALTITTLRPVRADANG